MLVPNILISFTDPSGKKIVDFTFVNKCVISKSRKTLTNSCTITLPRKIKAINGDINDFFKSGSKVVVQLGYGSDLRNEFTGYVAKRGAKIPMDIYCEDEMWKLKQNSFTRSWKKVKLKELVSYIYPGTSRVADIELGGFTIKAQSTAQVLDALKKFSLQCYFDADGVLVVDFAGSLTGKRIEAVYDFDMNIIDTNLEYNRKEDIRIRVKGISKQPNGKSIEVFFGDPDGDERTLNFVNLDKVALNKIVEKELNKLKQDGYRNDFETFGLPYAEPGYVAVLTSSDYPERDGSYLIESVETEMGVDGFRRKITLERKVL